MVKINPVNISSSDGQTSVKDGIKQKSINGYSLGCTEMKKVSVGLKNLGNTCFLNSTLQCLLHTSPLYNFLNSQVHEQTCHTKKFCMICELKNLVKACFSSGSSSVNPQGILRNLKLIASHLRWGRQEDAHEFLRYVIDSMHKSSSSSTSKKNSEKKPSIAEKIFQGELESQVKCFQCQHVSTTCDPFLDLSVDVKNVQSVEIGLEKFTAPETLQGSNAYMCSNCKKKVKATKRFKLRKLPKVLTIQLKRYSPFGGKVTSHVNFPEVLNLAPYVSKQSVNKLSMQYNLYAVLIHEGNSTKSGHYYSHVKGPNNKWYCMNDSNVSSISLQQVLRSQAYLLFYVQKQNHLEKTISNSIESKPTQNGMCEPNSNGIKEKLEQKTKVVPSSLDSSKTVAEDPSPMITNDNLPSKNTTPVKLFKEKSETVTDVIPKSDSAVIKNSSTNDKDCIMQNGSPKKSALNGPSSTLNSSSTMNESSSTLIASSTMNESSSTLNASSILKSSSTLNESSIMNGSTTSNGLITELKFTTSWKVTDLKCDETQQEVTSFKSTSTWIIDNVETISTPTLENEILPNKMEMEILPNKMEIAFTCPTFDWDNKRSHITLELKEDDEKMKELEKKKLTYGRPILTWGGEQPVADSADDDAPKSDRKRKWDLMDEEIDRGKERKIKKKKQFRNIEDGFKAHADKCYTKNLTNGHH